MLNKHTFGKSPAAIYLTDHLNQLNNKSLVRKVTVLLCSIQRIINELEQSNIAGHLSAHVLGSLVEGVRDRANDGYWAVRNVDKLTAQLMHNVMLGSIKELIRKTTKVRVCELAQARIPSIVYANSMKTPDFSVNDIKIATIREGYNGVHKILKYPINVGCVTDNINADTLTEKSKAKLQRKNKPNNLY